MSTRVLRVFSAIALATLWCVPAFATQRAPVAHLRLASDPQVVPKGGRYDGILEVSSAWGGTLSQLRTEGTGWTLVGLEASGFVLKPGVPQQVRFSVTAVDPELPLSFTAQLDTEPVRADFNLSPALMQSLVAPPLLENVDPKLAEPSLMLSLPSPEPGTSEPRSLTPQANLSATKVRVFGRIVYRRPDGRTPGVDGVKVIVYEDFITDTEMASGVTDASGGFDLNFSWDYCTFCRKPNLYIKVISKNGVVSVLPPGFGWSYAWVSNVVREFPGGDLDLGTLAPTGGNHQALHILTDTVRNWRFLDARQGYDMPALNVRWPEFGSGAFYDTVAHEMHISRDREWNEDTHAHEYGHHWASNYGSSETPAYCNGTCDTNAFDCGHCQWCRETAPDAWAEGFADWFADLMTRSYGPDYGVVPLNMRNMETLARCFATGGFDDPQRTEGFLGALLRDIEDSTQEAEPSMPGQVDALALGAADILTVADFYDTRTPSDFLARFKQHFPQHTVPLWKTAANAGYVDGADPCQASVPSDRWKGEYFLGSDFTTPVIATREDAAPSFDWGSGSPHPDCGIPADNFAVRWTKRITVPGGLYRLSVTADDGVKVFVDGALHINAWVDQSPTTYTKELHLTAGTHDVRIEYYERGAGAVLRFDLTPLCTQTVESNRWKGEYFPNLTLSGTPLLVRNDSNANGLLSYNWGSASPHPECGLPADNFSARFTRTESFSSGTYRFTVTADDGVRLYVDGVLKIDRWVDQASSTYTADVALRAGYHTVRVEYYERGVGAVISAGWASTLNLP
jgi:hypothetical protein